MTPCVVIHTCDKYEFCWDGWHYFFSKFWMPYVDWPVFFVYEVKDVDYVGIEQIKTGVGEWSDRLIGALSSLTFEHVFYFQEDVWLRRPVGVIFQLLYELFVAESMDALRVMKLYSMMRFESTEFVVCDRGVHRCLESSVLLMNHQPSFWKRDVLLRSLTPGQDPWQSEKRDGGRMAKLGLQHKIFVFPMRWYLNVSRRGALIDDGVNVLRRIKDGEDVVKW